MSAETDTGVSTCRHCGRRIVRVRYAMGEKWMHQPQGAAFQDNMHEWCHLTTAGPGNPEQADPEQTTSQPPPCPDHVERQHRDGKPPWCNRCGWTRALSAPATKHGKSRAERDAARLSDLP
jgi:hypothetical protein